jgi:hypothetical protein
MTERRRRQVHDHSRIETQTNPRRMIMKTEWSPKARTVLSGVAAFAITTVLVSTLVEALNPALVLSANGYSEPQKIAATNLRRDANPALEA